MPTGTAPPLDLTLVLAATRDMGIGRNGTLPWTGLKKEMAYFARVTKRLPPPPSSSTSTSSTTTPSSTMINAVIMGRRTWESIPPRFRPLAGRLNVVVSRTQNQADMLPAIGYLVGLRDGHANANANGNGNGGLKVQLGRVFVIGGAQIYGAALALGLKDGAGAGAEVRRILLTRVHTHFECDIFFPLKLGEEQPGNGGWKKAAPEEMDDWVGEEVPKGVQNEAGTEYEFEMWEKVD
ncbi:hypothetical protein N656DRAFT_706065 [Canariomyces notabilis]|uniref:Dihydrofolate reductase n=1 Tax=Canariomyces notabilis TaxID=2074819 RepID=A0AAN6TGR7_9PEZI|nr:hypothetical protein N656DRAFT_706065 [Canariomyces arenarius]